MLNSIVCLLLVILSCCQRRTAIQTSKQTYFAYLPLTDCPLAPGQAQGAASYQSLTPAFSFQRIRDDQGLTFWGMVEGGMDILPHQHQLITPPYLQVLYSNSLASSDLQSRAVLLTSFTPEGNIVLTEAFPFFSNGTLTYSTSSNSTSNFSLPQREYIEECFSRGSQPRLGFIGNSSFLVLCPGSEQLFSFSTASGEVFSFEMGAQLQSLASNPLLLLPGPPQISPLWNAALLSNNSEDISFCLLNQSSKSCSGFGEEQKWIGMVTDRDWGLQNSAQEDTFFSLKEAEPYLSSVNFTGTIISVFRQRDIFYLESVQQGRTYLTVFQGQELLIDTPLEGSVVYYGRTDIAVEAGNGTFMLASFLLPYFTLSGITAPTTVSQEVRCRSYSYVRNLSVLPTSYEYPSALVIDLDSKSKVAGEGTLTYELSDDYQVIGPDFQVFVYTGKEIEIALLASSVIGTSARIMAVLEVDFLEMSKPHLLVYFLNQLAEFHQASSQSQQSQVVAKNPCGFSRVAKTQKAGKHYMIYSPSGDLCICQSFLANCTLESFQGGTGQEEVDLAPANGESSLLEAVLLEEKRLIVVDGNGTVSLQGLEGEVYASIQSNCSEGATRALLFPQRFRDDSVVVFCEGGESLSQWVLRGDQFLWQREVPLYGFMVRPQGSFFAGSTSLFLEVDFNTSYMAPNISQEIASCCVLRIDPTAFTVSAISEIVEVKEVAFVETAQGVDIAYYNQTTLQETSSFLKIYFGSTFISFSQPPLCQSLAPCPPASYHFYLNFGSLLYNFGATVRQTVTFNLSSSSLLAQPQDLSLFLAQSQVDESPESAGGDLKQEGDPGEGPDPMYVGRQGLNFSWLCGPLMNFEVGVQPQPSADSDYLFSLSTERVLTRNKLIQSLDSLILQAIDLGDLLPDSPFSSLLMLVSASSVSFYTKYSSQWLLLELAHPLPLPNCFYHLHSAPQLPQPQAIFSSTCYNYQDQVPLLTLQRNTSGSLQLSLSRTNFTAQLKRVVSFPQEDGPPLIFGVDSGPPKAATGLLKICQVHCGSLATGAQVQFLVDFDATRLGGGVLVVGVDLESLSFWLDPPPPLPGQSIKPFQKVQYRQLAEDYCDLVKIVEAVSLKNLTLLLTCHSSYILVGVNADAGALWRLHSYLKFPNCDPSSSTKPILKLSNGSVVLMVAECPGSEEVVQTEQLEESSSGVVTTAYLQVFTWSGPLCAPGRWAPIRVLPLSITEPMETYLLYQVNGTLKLLYEEVSGFLVDSFVELQPSTSLTLAELTEQEEYPQLTLTLTNPYYRLEFPISTEPEPSRLSVVATLVLEVVFICVNALTLLFLLCWFSCKKFSKGSLVSLGRVGEKPEKSSEPPSPSSLLTGDRTSSREAPRPARRVTEIELFQPRYD